MTRSSFSLSNAALFPKTVAAGCLAFATMIGSAAPSLAQDAAAGEAVFKKCMTCHRIGEGAKNAVGPEQNGLIGRQAGTVPGFAYSPLNKAAGEAGLIWTEDTIFEYLPDPNGFLIGFLKSKGKDDLAKGSTKMAFKLTSEKERKDVIAYLKKFSPGK